MENEATDGLMTRNYPRSQDGWRAKFKKGQGIKVIPKDFVTRASYT